LKGGETVKHLVIVRNGEEQYGYLTTRGNKQMKRVANKIKEYFKEGYKVNLLSGFNTNDSNAIFNCIFGVDVKKGTTLDRYGCDAGYSWEREILEFVEFNSKEIDMLILIVKIPFKDYFPENFAKTEFGVDLDSHHYSILEGEALIIDCEERTFRLTNKKKAFS
jgi:hypothetical protein